MNLRRLEIRDLKKVRHFDVKLPPDGLVKIVGENDAGKTTVLDAVQWLLAGKTGIQILPIRKGADSALIKGDFGQFTVTRKFTAKGTSLEITTADGDTKRSPQDFLNKLLGHLSFDPIRFATMSPEDQFDELRRVAKIDVAALQQLDRENAADYERRKLINADRRKLESRASSFTFEYPPMEVPVSLTEIVQEMQEANAKNLEIGRQARRRTNLGRAIETTEKEIAHLKAKLATGVEALSAFIVELAALPDPQTEIDLTPYRERHAEAEAMNADFRKRQDHATVLAEASELMNRSDTFTRQMEARDKAKADAIAKAEMPVPGLSLGDGIVLFEGIPFDQQGKATQIRTSVSIAMAGDPGLRIALVRDCGLLDERGMKMLEDLASEKKFLVLAEVMQNAGPDGIRVDVGMIGLVGGEVKLAESSTTDHPVALARNDAVELPA